MVILHTSPYPHLSHLTTQWLIQAIIETCGWVVGRWQPTLV